MGGPTQVETRGEPRHAGPEPQPSVSDTEISDLRGPQTPPYTYEEKRDGFDDARREIWSQLSRNIKDCPPELPRLVLSALDTTLAFSDESKTPAAVEAIRARAREVYEGILPGEQHNLAPFKEFLDFVSAPDGPFKTQFDGLMAEKAELKQQVADLSARLERSSSTLPGNGPATGPDPTGPDPTGTDPTGTQPQVDSQPRPQSQTQPERQVQPEPDQQIQPEQQVQPERQAEQPAQKPLIAESQRVEFHQQLRGDELKAHARQLRIGADGQVEMLFSTREGGTTWLAQKDTSTGIEVAALFCVERNGRTEVYDREGNRVEALQWGPQTRVGIDRALEYFNRPTEGGIAGVKDGYLKTMRYQDKEVVLTRGLPPSMRQEQPAPSIEQPSPQAEESSPPSSVQPERQAEPRSERSPEPERRDPQPDTDPQLSEPQLPEPPQRELEAAGPSNWINFNTRDQYGRNMTVRRDMRLDAEGRLQMRFKNADGSDAWLEPHDRSTGVKVSCLYRHEGKLYDASGQEVRNLSWAGMQASSQHVLNYVDPLKEGQVSGIRSGYSSDIRHNGNAVVFTEGLPPGIDTPSQLQQTQAARPVYQQQQQVYQQQPEYQQVQRQCQQGSYHYGNYQQRGYYNSYQSNRGGLLRRVFGR